MAKPAKANRMFLFSTIALTIIGVFIFTSASLGLLAKSGADFKDVASNQIFLGLFLGAISLITFSKIDYHKWRKHALLIFIASFVLTLLVFVPGLGFEHNGARRWLAIGSFSFQPAEFLKLAFVIYFAAWLSGIKDGVKKLHLGLLPLLILTGFLTVLLKQPDTGTFVIIFISGVAMFIVAGARWRDIIILLIITIFGATYIAATRPYIQERISTFLNPSEDALGASYQLRQSIIAIGSGKLSGRGLGQSIQKFGFLPEPMGDSIFAVLSEEFGFIGSTTLIALFIFFVYQGFRVAIKSSDLFGGLLTVGIITLIISQSFFNIASMLGIVPLSGLPLIFVSHGGTALFFALTSVGIVLNVSKN